MGLTMGLKIHIVLIMVFLLYSTGWGYADMIPEYAPGDWWEYGVSGAYNLKGKVRMEVEGIVPISFQGKNISVYVLNITRSGGGGPPNGRIFLTMDMGRIREEYPSGIIEYSPPFQYFRFPITPGKSYEYQYTRSVHQGNQTVKDQVTLRVYIKSLEDKTVDAGRFDSFYIEVFEVNTSSVFKLWYAERAGNLVVYEYWFGDTLSERWSLLGYSFSRGPDTHVDILPIIIIITGAGVPLIVLIIYRKRLMNVVKGVTIHHKGKKKRGRRKKDGMVRFNKVYNRNNDKGDA